MKTSKSPKLSTNPKRELTGIAMRYRLSAIFAFGSRSADAEAIINRKRCSGEYSAADEYGLYILRRAGDLIPLEEERISLIMGGN
jgi:hypothetical protein